MNTLTPVVTFVCLLLFERWLRWASLAYAIAAAVSLYVLVFFEPVPLVIGAFVALILARALMQGDIVWNTLIRQGGLIVATFMGMIALVWLLFDFNLVDALHRVAADAAGSMPTTARMRCSRGATSSSSASAPVSCRWCCSGSLRQMGFADARARS